MNKFIRCITFLACVSLINGCGGSGGNENDDDDQPGDDVPAAFMLPSLINASLPIDIDGDGDLDLLIGNQGDQRSAADLVLINEGDFNFKAKFDAVPERYKGLGGGTVSYVTLDANSDGHSDVIAVTVDTGEDYYGSSQLQLWLGTGDGQLIEATNNIAGNLLTRWPEWVRVGDFDNDGSPDFMLTVSGCAYPTNEGGSEADEQCYGGRTYLNDGDGNFAVAPITMRDHVGALVDDRLLWRGAGSASESGTSLRPAIDVLVDDYNGDGRIDLFAPNGGSAGAMATFINESTPGNLSFSIVYSGYSGDGSTANDTIYDTPRMRNGISIDLNGDQAPDALVSWGISDANGETVPLRAMINNGNGFFEFDDSILEGNIGLEHARQWLKADINADGFDDVLIADHGYDRDRFPGEPNVLLLSAADGKLVDRSDMLRIWPELERNASTYTHGASLADLDGDGDIDIFLNNATKNEGAPVDWENENPIWRYDGGIAFTSIETSVSE